MFRIFSFVLAGLLTFALAGCSGDNAATDAESPAAQISEPAVQESSGASQNTPSSEDPPNTEPVLTEIEVDFYGEAAGNPRRISVALPADWTYQSAGIFDGEGRSIASFELQPATDPAQPFADIDTMFPDVVSSDELTIGAYPAKHYTLRLAVDGSETELRTQHLYYILVDDAYVLLFFSPEVDTPEAEAQFAAIAASFQML